jgi:hypothetical protein
MPSIQNLGIKLTGAFAINIAIISSIAEAHGIHYDEPVIQASGWERFSDFLGIGMQHMLTGFDHLLFVLGLIILVAVKLKPVTTLITAFTLGHSLTLIAGTYFGWKVNYVLIDVIIALSVAYVGYLIIKRGKIPRWMPPIPITVGLLGLIHGLGLSTRLQNLDLPHQGLFGAILGFNIGVELGQLIALIVLLGGAWVVRRAYGGLGLTRYAGMLLLAIGIILAGFMLITQLNT